MARLSVPRVHGDSEVYQQEEARTGSYKKHVRNFAGSRYGLSFVI